MSPSVASNTLKFQTNIPERVTLQYAEGRQVQSQFGGDQVMYTLADGRKMYLPPHVAGQITQLGIGAGREFFICKRETAHGNRRVVDYHVELDPRPNQTNPVEPARRGPQLIAPQTAPPASHPSAEKDYAALLAASIADARAKKTGGAASETADRDSAIVATGIEAIDAILAVEAYAESRGMTDFAFGADNIQKIWISLYIEHRGRR